LNGLPRQKKTLSEETADALEHPACDCRSA
jgi:hypothetical protein